MPSLPAGCEGICVADNAADALGSLRYSPRTALCADCSTLDTPWAKTDEARQNAVDGTFRATGPGPTRFRVAIPEAHGGVVGIFSEAGAPLVAYRVKIQGENAEPCGRIAALKFSPEGDLGAHVLVTVDTPQPFFLAPSGGSADVLSQPRAFEWPTDVTQQQGINDMWFSRQVAAADVSGALWIATYETRTAVRVSDLPGATAGQYYSAQVVGTDVLAAHEETGYTEWAVVRQGRVSPLLGDAKHDIPALATDGTSIVWLEGTDPQPTGSDGPARFTHHRLVASPYATDAAKLEPHALLDPAPEGLSYLNLANGYVAGIYLVSTNPNRAAAVVVRLADAKALKAELPGGYGWGYEVYPSETALMGPVTTTGMVRFETVLRMPYTSMTAM